MFFARSWAFVFAAIVIVVVSLLTKPGRWPNSTAWSTAPPVLPTEEPVPFYKNEYMWAILVVVIFAALNIMFW